jgi:uncharacterized OsmC-like protein
MTMRIVHRGNGRFDLTSGNHTVVTDQPVADGGGDAGMSPVELFVGSLASCVGYFVARYCVRHQIPCEGLTIEAGWTYAEQPHRVGGIDLQLNLPATLSPSQQQALLKVAHGCTVHQSLAIPPKVEIHVTAPNSKTEVRS